MAATLYDLIPRNEKISNDLLLENFLDYVAGRRLQLYPAQENAILELFDEKNVILNTPTGSGKSLVATALHFQAIAKGRRSIYTCPIKALVNEKFMALCREFGPDNVGLSTGDASVNRDAPILCCTAEILANIALREGPAANVRDVVMDEFHYYADRERGVAWQVPLLTLPQARFLLMSATLGDTTFFEEELTQLNRRATVTVSSTDRPVPLAFEYSELPLAQRRWKASSAVRSRAGLCRPLHATGSGAERAGFHQHQRLFARGKSRHRQHAGRFQVHQSLRPGNQEVAAAWHRLASRRVAAEISRAGRAARAKGIAQGHLRHGHARRGHQRADPHRAVHAAVQVRRPEDRHFERAGFSSDQRPRGAQRF